MSAYLNKIAPQFECSAVVNGAFEKVKLSDYKGKYVVLFFYPKDFTFVCPTEIIAFSDAAKKFEATNTVLLGASTDTEYSHLAWINQPRKEGGLGGIDIPLIADVKKEIATAYGVLNDDGVCYRGLFIIDRDQKVRIMQVNDDPVGRSVEETFRLLEALQFTDEHGEVCPANWQKGSATIVPDVDNSKKFFGNQN